MTVKSADLINGQPVVTRRNPGAATIAVAVIIWIAGAAASYAGISAMLQDIPVWLGIIVAVVTQLVLTFVERPALAGQFNVASIGALLLDVALNAGGLYPALRNVGETPTATMLMSVFNLDPGVSPIGAFLLSVIVGYIIAATPESMIRQSMMRRA
jgi:hypothetical protein